MNYLTITERIFAIGTKQGIHFLFYQKLREMTEMKKYLIFNRSGYEFKTRPSLFPNVNANLNCEYSLEFMILF